MPNRAYRALIRRTGVPSGGSTLHLVREDAEASLRGLPRASLGPAGGFDELVCAECIEWLPKRVDFSEAHPRMDNPG